MVLHGERLDRPTYNFLTTINEGNTGMAYLGVHEVYDRKVVQKVISLLGVEDAIAFNEPRMLNEMRHPHLVEVWEAQWDPDNKAVKAITFTMPFYEGGSVNQQLATGSRFSLAEAVSVTRGTLSALHYLHVERAVLHRDIKPGNIFLSADRRHPYLGDLGSAVTMTPARDAEARSGTPLYRPPENHLGRYTVRGELYGLGMTLREMLHGPYPYADFDDATIATRLDAGRRAIPDRFYEITAPQVPDALARLARSLTHADPARRPASAADALRRLDSIRYLTWHVVHEDADRVVWDATWSNQPANRARVYRIELTQIRRGRYAGLVRAEARWRPPGTAAWRGIRALDARLRSDDRAALRGVFSAVEQAAR